MHDDDETSFPVRTFMIGDECHLQLGTLVVPMTNLVAIHLQHGTGSEKAVYVESAGIEPQTYTGADAEAIRDYLDACKRGLGDS